MSLIHFSRYILVTKSADKESNDKHPYGLISSNISRRTCVFDHGAILLITSFSDITIILLRSNVTSANMKSQAAFS